MPRRTGMIIPVVIFCLVVMAILGVVLISSATSQYMQTAKVAASLKVREVLNAGFEETQALAYDKLQRPVAPGAPAAAGVDPVWHTELQTALRSAGAGLSPRTVLVKHDLKAENLVPRTARIASTLACEITSGTVEFLGFKRLSMDSKGLFEDPRIYYRDPDGKLDADGPPGRLDPVKEWVGSMRVRITVRWEHTKTTLSRVQDVKVVNVDPVAREFGLFSFLSTQADETPELDEYYRNDLRRGGPVRLFMHAIGRIFVRGPFIVDTVGFPGGEGGKRPPHTASYSPPVENEWWGWGQVPSTHDGIMTRAGISVVNFAMPPMRPDTSSDWRAVTGLVTQRFGSSWADWFNDDPGFYILDGQTWYSESTSSDRNIFSIWGDPVGGHMEPYRGALVVYDKDNRDRDRNRTVHAPSEVAFQDNTIARPPNEDQRWVIEPEGQLYGQYNVVSYSGDSYALGAFEKYSITQKSPVVGKLGIHWE